MFIEVVGRPDIETSGIAGISRVGGLMKYFRTRCKFVGQLSLKQHTRKPKVFVCCSARVDPIAGTAVDNPIAKALLKPHGEKRLKVAYTEAAVFVAGRQIQQGKYRNLRAPTPTVFLDEPVLKANWHIAVPQPHSAAGGIVKCGHGVNCELAVRDEAVVELDARQGPGGLAANQCPG